MAFKRSSKAMAIPADPVQLYRQLAETNDGPESLWYHQGEVLLDWHEKHQDAHDVAIELPTGAGKTMVGGLIGDFRRRAFKERVAYLCPTRQLAKQTSEKLTEYGIPNVLLIGKVRDWNHADRARYTSADAIAVSVYSHVFNTNPALSDAELLLLDDAHAAESAVATPWSLEIHRDNEKSAYFDVLAALGEALHPSIRARLSAETANHHYSSDVYLASPSGVAAESASIERAVADAVSRRKLSEDSEYAYRFLQGCLDRCLFYVSYGRLLIRPLIPPTLFHPAFEDPNRRIYMSATLGAGGELERIFGRQKIARIPVPAGWEKQGTGRRLFCFPELTTDLATDPEVASWVANTIEKYGRALVLTPDNPTATKFKEACLPEGYKVYKAIDVEDNLATFTDEPQATLILSNRYDGIDLPDDDCRLVVLVGLPARGDLQERFLYGSLGAVEILQERIRARIMQGAGRATRNSKDFAAVLVVGSDLVSYVSRRDVQEAMHPEIHAELEFGWVHSIDSASTDMLENLEVFIEHSDEWREVDLDIVDAREEYERVDAPGAVELQEAVSYEVSACNAMWQGDWADALEAIRQIRSVLHHGRASQRYSAFWSYLASNIARRLAVQTGDDSFDRTATELLAEAREVGRGALWLAHPTAPAEVDAAPAQTQLDSLDELAMNTIKEKFTELTKTRGFDENLTRARGALEATDPKPYERALVLLGRLAGAGLSEGDGGAQAAPDATWVFGTKLWIAWEAKSDAKVSSEVAVRAVRQAGGHLRYVEDSRDESSPGESCSLLVTPQEGIHPSARAVAESHVYLVSPVQVVELFDKIARSWNTIRSRDIKSLEISDLANIFATNQALPTQWLSNLRTAPLSEIGSSEDGLSKHNK